MVRRSLLRILVAVAVLSPATAFAQAAAGPTIVTINGNPLKINVAADGSFQVFNNAVPGTGQIYPTSCNYGDMGIFAVINGTLFSPNFTAHTCGTATGGLGTHSVWASGTISQVQGAGDGPSPFTVTETLSGGGVTVAMTVTYVNGDNFFRLRTQFSGSGSRTMNFDVGRLNRTMVLENTVIFGTVNANRGHYEAAASALARADREAPEGPVRRPERRRGCAPIPPSSRRRPRCSRAAGFRSSMPGAGCSPPAPRRRWRSLPSNSARRWC